MAAGRLFVVATPIGNLEDVTARALRVLNEVDLIAAEDTRHSKRFLRHYGITTPVVSYYDQKERVQAEKLCRELERGRNVALITDAGTPCISDPGYHLVRAARRRGIPIAAVPGPSALMAALSVVGLPTDRFAFHGFFPRKQGEAEALLRKIASWRGAHLFFESPNRLETTLRRVHEMLPDTEVAIARELTKRFEEVVTGTPLEVLDRFSAAPARGECVVLIHVATSGPERPGPGAEELRILVNETMIREGISKRDAIRSVAETLGLPRNRVYAAVTGKASTR